jgi:hypothetical protein
MTQAYSDPSRELEPYALPDIELFYVAESEFITAKKDSWEYYFICNDHDLEEGSVPSQKEKKVSSENLSGFYYWFCFPGCMPETEYPFGPFTSEKNALDDAQEN